MPHIVTEACIKCRYTDCVEVCPVDAFHAHSKMLVIGEECIDCGLCVSECAPKAIYAEEDLPLTQSIFKPLNLAWAKQLPVITRRESPLPEATEWQKQSNKRDQIPDLLALVEEEENT